MVEPQYDPCGEANSAEGSVAFRSRERTSVRKASHTIAPIPAPLLLRFHLAFARSRNRVRIQWDRRLAVDNLVDEAVFLGFLR
jgi:hypothetical protein